MSSQLEIDCLHYIFFHLATGTSDRPASAEAGGSDAAPAPGKEGVEVFLAQAEPIRTWVAHMTQQPKAVIDTAWAQKTADLTDRKADLPRLVGVENRGGGFRSVNLIDNLKMGDGGYCDVAAQRWNDVASWLVVTKARVPQGMAPEDLLYAYCKGRWQVAADSNILGQSIVGRVRGVQPARQIAHTYLRPYTLRPVNAATDLTSGGEMHGQADTLTYALNSDVASSRDSDISETQVLEGQAGLYTLSMDAQPWWWSARTWLMLQIVMNDDSVEKALDDLTVDVLWHLEVASHKVRHERDRYQDAQGTQEAMRDHLYRARRTIKTIVPEVPQMAEGLVARPSNQGRPAQPENSLVVRQDLATKTAKELVEEEQRAIRTYMHLSLAITDAKFAQSALETNYDNLTKLSRRLVHGRITNNNVNVYDERVDLAEWTLQQIRGDLSRAEPMQRALETILGTFRDYLEGARQRDERTAERRVTTAVTILTMAQVYGVGVAVITSTSWPKSLWPPSLDLHHVPPQGIAFLPVLLLLILGIGFLLERWRLLSFLVLMLLACLRA